MKAAGVIGGGAWGTALAQVCARAGLSPTLWAREPEVVAAINSGHENGLFLPGVVLDPAIRATGDLAELSGRAALDDNPNCPIEHLLVDLFQGEKSTLANAGVRVRRSLA